MSSKFRILFLCCLGCFVGSVLRADDGEGLTVAVVFDGPGWYFDTLSAAVQEEVAGLSRAPVQFLFEDRFNAQWDPARYAAVLDAALTAEEVDVVFAAGVMVAQAAAVPGKVLPKPVLAGYLQDPSMIEIPLTDAGASAKENFAFVVSHERIRRDLLAVHRLFRPSRVDVLMDEALVAGMQGLDGTRAGLEETLGMGLNLIPVRGDPAAALAKVPADAEVVYVTPMLRMDDGARATLYAGLNAREIPTFAMLGVTDLRVGALAGLTSVEHPRLARRMALNLLAMGAGRSAAELPVDLAVPEQLFFNEVTLGLVGFRPSVGVLLQARFLEHADQYESGNELRLEDAVAHALVGNPDMARAASRVAEADGSRRLTRGGLGPQLSLSGQWVELDEERSAASLGMQPRSRVTAGVVLRQSIFDEMAHRRFRAAGHFLTAQTWEQADTKLDVVTEVSLRFFDALSARELVKVEEDQLERIRDLLALARLRVAVGETPREDALRWEAEEAERTAAVLVAHARAQSAMAALNVSMGLPAETPWRLAAVVLEDTETYFMDERLDFATGSFQMIRALSGFWREFGLEQSPVLQALDAAVAAQDQIVSGRRRARYLPEVGLEARVDHVVDRRTAGAGLDDVAAGFGCRCKCRMRLKMSGAWPWWRKFRYLTVGFAGRNGTGHRRIYASWRPCLRRPGSRRMRASWPPTRASRVRSLRSV